MPDRLRRWFPHLESLKLKGKPQEAMFNLIPEDWGGFITTWVIDISQYFNCLKSLHFRHMIVRDSDLEVLARSRGHILQALKLDKCSGFSTDGLYYIDRYCR
ncbi:Coronatine-insensitive protein 1 [Glycine soja]|uniref:Coronatine-insensitive protein 1 n=1 Tax=Glycine soja TaxID=3848 RepID=A0A0B2QTR7_GLYSO|nr:Coronatine-insensitive protein 1 [Glycine soja]